MKHAESLSDDTLVAVRRHPLNYQTAMYRFGEVTALHWSTASGGVGTATSHLTLFGYVWCNAMASGELAHSCSHGPPPHHIKVCFVKKLNQPMWRQILHRAPALPSNAEGQSMSKDQDHSARAGWWRSPAVCRGRWLRPLRGSSS